MSFRAIVNAYLSGAIHAIFLCHFVAGQTLDSSGHLGQQDYPKGQEQIFHCHHYRYLVSPSSILINTLSFPQFKFYPSSYTVMREVSSCPLTKKKKILILNTLKNLKKSTRPMWKSFFIPGVVKNLNNVKRAYTYQRPIELSGGTFSALFWPGHKFSLTVFASETK